PTTRDPAARETECERKCVHDYADSGSFCPGSVTEALVRRQGAARAAWGERLVSAWHRTLHRDFSTTPAVDFAPFVSARNDRLAIYMNQVYRCYWQLAQLKPTHALMFREAVWVCFSCGIC